MITHPFHPLRGRAVRIYDRVGGSKRAMVRYFADSPGGPTVVGIPIFWTSLWRADDFERVASGRSLFRADDLVALREAVDSLLSPALERVQKLGRSCAAVLGKECRAMAGTGPIMAGRSRPIVDLGGVCSVLFFKTRPEHFTAMKKRRDPTDKQDRLRQAGTLNRTPERVSDPLLAVGDFFDARDLLQVRYEMVRLVRLGEAALAQAAERFGVSRPTCFRMLKAFDGGGLQGLIPARRGPRGPHKIGPEIVRFVEDYRAEHGRVGARRLVPLIEAEFGVRVHPRGLEKALARAQKKPLDPQT